MARTPAGGTFKKALRSAILLFCFADDAAAQIGNPFDQSSQCDLSTLTGRIHELNAACCINPKTTERKDQCDLEVCDGECVSVLLPLRDECGSLLDKLYDGTDGKEDGIAQAFSTLHSQCLTIPIPEILDDLKALQAQGQCPDDVLDGVATAEVEGPVCRDTWQNHPGCEAAIASGFLTCEADFCDTPPTTSAFNNSAASSFEAEASRVEDACCDVATQTNVCDSGVPTTCDAKCAVVFGDFYDRCQ